MVPTSGGSPSSWARISRSSVPWCFIRHPLTWRPHRIVGREHRTNTRTNTFRISLSECRESGVRVRLVVVPCWGSVGLINPSPRVWSSPTAFVRSWSRLGTSSPLRHGLLRFPPWHYLRTIIFFGERFTHQFRWPMPHLLLCIVILETTLVKLGCSLGSLSVMLLMVLHRDWSLPLS